MQTHFDLFLCGSFNSDSQVLSRFWRVREDINGLDLDRVSRQALERKESVELWAMWRLYRQLTTVDPTPTLGSVDRSIRISELLSERSCVGCKG